MLILFQILVLVNYNNPGLLVIFQKCDNLKTPQPESLP